MNQVKTCLAPNFDTHKPQFCPPKNSCDAHCHVFGPASIFPYCKNSTYHPPDAGKDRLKTMHQVLGIDRAVIVQASCHGVDNQAMLDAIASSNGQYRGVCIADANLTQQDFQTLHNGGVRGVRFNFVKHLGGAPNLDMMRRVIHRVQPLGWHLVVHVNAEDMVAYQSFFAEFDLDIIVDHMGRVPTDQGLDQAAFKILCRFLESDNWWVKICGAERISTTGPPFHDALPFIKKLVQLVPDRVLWGTDFPHPNIKQHMPNDGDLLDLVPLFAENSHLQHKILVENPAKLYGFEPSHRIKNRNKNV